MKAIFVSVIFISAFVQCYGCKSLYDTSCNADDDCCSEICYKELNWKFGVCKPEETNYPPLFNKCADDFSEHCVVNEHCCSGLCDKRPNQKFGVCRPNECEPLYSRKLAILCYAPSNKTTSCYKSLKTNSRATFRCNTPIYRNLKEQEYNQITCRFGKWDRPLVDDFCKVDCGRSVSEGSESAAEFKNLSNFGEFPWNAGIYYVNHSRGEYDQICGGTLISSKIVISAAHCFVNENSDTRKIEFKDLTKMKVALGKYYRNINASKDTFAQIKDVASIEIAPEFKGYWKSYVGDIAFIVLAEKIEYSWAVLPVCIDVGEGNFERDQLVEGVMGKVVGWGLTSKGVSSEKLKLMEVPYVQPEKCHGDIEFPWLHYLSNEKICAGYAKNLSKICNGNSGGGLVFMEPTTEKYYLRGIVSLSPTCNFEGFSLFTKLSSYKELVERYLTRS